MTPECELCASDLDRRKLGKGKLPTRAEAQVVWLSRDGAPAGTTDLLERAVRDMEWLPGTAYAWVAGETVTLKGIRRHLVTERQVAREHTHITGYWRRTTPAPAAPGDADAHGQVAADHLEAEADDAHELLHRLTDPAPGHAIRAAVTLGLFELVDGGTRDAARLAERTGADPVTLTALLTYLVSIDLLALDGDGYRLTAVSEELVEDGHSADEYHLGGAQAALDASLSGLVPTLLTGRAGYRTAAGETFVEAMAHDARLAGTARAAVEEEARWIAPGVVRAHDWSAVPEVTATGPGAGTVAGALVRAFPGLRARVTALPSVLRALREEILDTDVLPHVELVPQTGAAPAPGTRTLLMCRQLAWLGNEDAAHLLAETAAALAADGTLLLVEQVTGMVRWRESVAAMAACSAGSESTAVTLSTRAGFSCEWMSLTIVPVSAAGVCSAKKLDAFRKSLRLSPMKSSRIPKARARTPTRKPARPLRKQETDAERDRSRTQTRNIR